MEARVGGGEGRREAGQCANLDDAKVWVTGAPVCALFGVVRGSITAPSAHIGSYISRGFIHYA